MKRFLVFIAVIVVLSLAALSPLQAASSNWSLVKVVSVVDGDTIKVNLGAQQELVHLIGTLTPNVASQSKAAQPYGPEALAFTKGSMSSRSVYLEFDRQERNNDGCLLAYIWFEKPVGALIEDEVRNNQFNAQLLLEGYAKSSAVSPNLKYSAMYEEFQQEARDAGKGLWGIKDKIEITVYITRTGAKYHRLGCRYLSKSCIPISLANAKAAGYTPCSVCNPPQ